MTQFDQTTEQQAIEHHKKVNPFLAKDPYYQVPEHNQTIEAFTAGRNSVKESHVLACRALHEARLCCIAGEVHSAKQKCEEAIAAIKAAGNWLLEETAKEKVLNSKRPDPLRPSTMGVRIIHWVQKK